MPLSVRGSERGDWPSANPSARPGVGSQERNSDKLRGLTGYGSHGGLARFEAISHHNRFASGRPPAHKGTRHEEDSDCSGSGCERGCCHRRLVQACGCALLWLRCRRWPAGRLCCRRNSRQRIGKAISICLLRACSGLLWLLRAGAVLWLLALAPRVPLSGVLSCDAVRQRARRF